MKMSRKKKIEEECEHALVRVTYRVTGHWCELIEPDGEVYDTYLEDVVKRSFPKTGICADCGKRVKVPSGEVR